MRRRGAEQATDDNIMRRMRLACWITKATDSPAEYVMRTVFFTATMFTRARLNVTLYVYCLSYSNTNY